VIACNRPERIYQIRTLLAGGGYVAEPKEDGDRVIYMAGQLWTRHGRLHRMQPQHILDRLEPLPESTILDGEMLKDGSEYYGFDVLEIGGLQLTSKPLRYRRRVLEGIDVERVPQVHLGIPMAYNRWIEEGKEGMVLKRLDGHYRDQWLKVKP
jgi:ATP-dependent DNA ligase